VRVRWGQGGETLQFWRQSTESVRSAKHEHACVPEVGFLQWLQEYSSMSSQRTNLLHNRVQEAITTVSHPQQWQLQRYG
jgi:hypothetical protein